MLTEASWRPGFEPATPESRRGVLREVLFCSDLSRASESAFGHAHLLADRCGARLVLIHALEVDGPKDLEATPGPRREMWRRLERNAHERLTALAAALPQRADVIVARALSAAHALLYTVASRRPDLTVMATHGRHGVAHLVLGSVTEAVLAGGGAPVLCVREPAHGVALPYRRILVPTDLALTSRRAFPLAATLARAFDASVTALHVVPVPPQQHTWGITDVVDRSVPSEEAVAEFLAPEFAGLRVQPKVAFGSAWEQILETAREERCDLIALSTHGRDSVADHLFGSHAERVLRQSPCPVLVA